MAVPGEAGKGHVTEADLMVEYSFFGGAQGGWRARACSDDEPMYAEWGETTGDLYINDAVIVSACP